MKNLIVIKNPLVDHYVTILRDKKTDRTKFKYSLDKLSYILAGIIFSSLKTESLKIDTPLKKFTGKKIKNKVVLVPILRAGLGISAGFIDLYPSSIISHIGIYRNEQTLEPVKYYFKFPKIKNKTNLVTIILDPMIATGGSVISTLEHLFELGIRDIYIVSLLCAPEGIKAIEKKFPKNKLKGIKLVTCAVDERLNKEGYIIPGLGDAGDRTFGT